MIINNIVVGRAEGKCRLYGHAWAPLEAKEEGLFVQSTLICERCHSQLVETWRKATGLVEKKSMQYACGYLKEGGGDRLTVEDEGRIRSELWKGKTSETSERAI